MQSLRNTYIKQNKVSNILGSHTSKVEVICDKLLYRNTGTNLKLNNIHSLFVNQ